MRTTSAELKKAAHGSQTDEAALLLLEIDHPDLAEPIRVSSDGVNTPHGEDFLAIFERNSTAYLADGTQVAAGEPRYEQGGIRVEEGTENLLGATNGRPNTMTPYGTTPPAVTLVADSSSPFGGEAWEISFPDPVDASFAGSRAQTNTWAMTVDLAYAHTAWVIPPPAGMDGVRLYHTGPAGMPELLPTGRTKGAWVEYARMATAGATGDQYLAIMADTSAAAGKTLRIAACQTEQKDHTTSYVDGVRDNEDVIVPAGYLAEANGAVEIDWSPTGISARYGRLFSWGAGGSAERITIGRYADFPNRLDCIYQTEGTIFRLTPEIPGGFDPGVTYRAGLSWSAPGTVRAYVYDPSSDQLYQETTELPGPTDLTGYVVFHIGTYGSSSAGNAVIGGFRSSSRARTAVEIESAARLPLRPDADTTAFFSFAETLASHHCYQAFPFEITLPDDRDDQVSRARLRIDNVDRRIVEAVRSISGRPAVQLRLVLGSSPTVTELGPLQFELLDVSWDALVVEGELGYETEILDQGYPAHAMTPQYFPGLFR